MTIVCALHATSETWIGSDTQITEDGLRIVHQTKWVIEGTTALGYAGHGRTYNLLEDRKGDILVTADPEAVAKRLAAALRDAGFKPAEKDSWSEWGGTFLLATPHGIWDYDATLCHSPVGPFWARGSGRQFALGAAHALMRSGSAWSAIVPAALAAACALDTYCGGKPFFQRLVARS